MTRRASSLLSFASLSLLIILPTSVWPVSFQPIVPDELKMTSEAKAPGAQAIILFREVDRDDRGITPHQDVYFRIKILTEEGRKYGDIEIPFLKGSGKVVNIHARTIRPDGSVVDFTGKAFDKSIVKARNLKYMAKTFTMPDVQVGSILEYYYSEDLGEEFSLDSHWILSHELFTKRALFSLKPYPNLNLRLKSNMLPSGTPQPSEGRDGVITLEASNIPAFQTEDYMPPENELKSRVDFIYSQDSIEKDPDKYWRNFGTKVNSYLESYVGKRKAMESALSQIILPSDSPETKLQKIYTRVQQIRNTSYALEKTEQEQKRDKEKLLFNVEEVWKKQYGEKSEINWLFLGLVRAAGFEASCMLVPDRRNYFFVPETMESRRLDETVVVVTLNGKDRFFDPGAEFMPFAMLPWAETGVTGLKLNKDGGTWVLTPIPAAQESTIHRKADLNLNSETGELEGKVVVTYTGLEASQRRVDQRFGDDTEHRTFLEDEVKESIPVGCEVELTKQPDWKSSTAPLVAEYALKVPGWISAAGRRALFPIGLFSAPEKHLFDHANRLHPIYFEFPFQRSDDITVDLPLGWQISNVPEPQKLDAKAITYEFEAKNIKGQLHMNRLLNVDVMLLARDKYDNLRKIFQVVRTGDEQQVALLPTGPTTGAH